MTTLRPAAARRTQLFLPADRPERAAKAATSGADAVILDLEDALPAEARPGARDGLERLVADVRAAASVPVLVRVNSDDLADDVAAAVAARADGVLVPKVESAGRVREVDDLLGGADLEVQLLVETPRGLLAAAEIAAAGRRSTAMVLGVEDLAADLEVDPTSPYTDLRWAHATVLLAARAAGLTPYGLLGSLTNFRDLAALDEDARASRGFGYVGALCIHPAQVPVLNEAFSPTAAELDRARAVLDAMAEAERSGLAAAQLDGRMIDAPVVARARRLLERGES
ncbi:CoA ester lyase [Aeromicrobium sp. IC_218]|uniref:HpcH/HpaI aldolase/citrate lyase family protein n=1 Tax=Aeromicrobium sp. IC_218 TaxID=2545468 RepID=UPI001039E489|nr:CoA ester lyase [Aeromicrobium sp. IC_218]TCI99691.1 CoA ester lyase [Aeromicrobium sp. IC_218]